MTAATAKLTAAQRTALLVLSTARKTYGGTRHEWRGVGRAWLTRATARRLVAMGLIETRPTTLPGVFDYDVRATLAGCVAAVAL